MSTRKLYREYYFDTSKPVVLDNTTLLKDLLTDYGRGKSIDISITEQRIKDSASEHLPSDPSPRHRLPRYLFQLLPLWICLLIALILRIWLVVHTQGVLDGDEALVGIQAGHILHGEHPIYFYAQPYMGSLEAYLVALLFAIAGPSVWALRTEPMLLSLMVVWLTWKLAAALAEAAHLPPFARRFFMTIAALLAAVSPLYDGVIEMRTYGGYIETYVLMLILLLSVFQVTRRIRAGAPMKELGLRWAGISFVVGLGLWVNLLLASALMASTIWVGLFYLARLFKKNRQIPLHLRRAKLIVLKGLLLVVATVPAFMLGLAPALVWGATHQWRNVTYALHLGSINTLKLPLRLHYQSRLPLIRDQIYLYKTYVAPRVISGALPMENSNFATIRTFTLDAGLFCIFATLLLVAISFFWRHPQLLRMRRLCALPALFAICTAFIFCTSPASSVGLLSFLHDRAGRYATPLMLALPFFFAAIFTLVYLKAKPPARVWGNTLGRGSNLSFYFIKRIVDYAPVRRGLLCAILFLYLGVQVYTYAQADAGSTFQSPFCPIAPANNEPIIAYLQHEHVHYAWAISWIGYPISFKTNDSIVISDPRATFSRYALDRYPAYTEAVLRADHPAMLAFVRHDEAYPTLLSLLDSMQLSYHSMRFVSEPGTDILVVTSLSRALSPVELRAFAPVFHACI